MAKMIPPQIGDNVPSSAERRIFDLLANDPGTEGWTALHSLGLARRATGPYGEIDFVVVVPHEGIMCLEVKGGRVSCQDGVWRTQDRNDRVSVLKKSPFMQARESMFALRSSLLEHFGQAAPESQCPIGAAVVFPDVPCPPPTPEFERSDAIDSEDLSRPISASIRNTIKRRLAGFQVHRGERRPTPAQCRAILHYFRPNFDLVVAKSASLRRTESTLLSLTEEQYDRLDELEDNPRCLFEGAAGTGKTLLALEHAQRMDRRGASVLLVCFNRLLGTWLQRQTKDAGITAGTWHEVLREIITNSRVGDEFLTQEKTAQAADDPIALFEEVYPFYAELALEEHRPFDVLVVDEGQDLFSRATLQLMNRLLKGGLAGGRWAIFGDFTRQALYSQPSLSPQESLPDFADHFVRARLMINCRNTQRIAEDTAILGGFDTPPFKFGKEVGLPVEHRYWRTQSNLLQILTETVDRLVRDGVPVDDIVVLSPRRLENSALGSIEQISGIPIADCSRSLDTGQGCLRFSTIHSFKGLESNVTVIVDVDEVDDERSQSLLYVGMSRARGLLILLVHEKARRSIDARIRAALEKELTV